jgi:hypothetical protein
MYQSRLFCFHTESSINRALAYQYFGMKVQEVMSIMLYCERARKTE